MAIENVPARQRSMLAAAFPGHPMPFAGMSKEDRAAAMIAIVERNIDGEAIEHIADELGVTRHRLYKLLAEHAEDAWKSAQVARALMASDEAEEALRLAKTLTEVARANGLMRSAQWQLERLWRRLYGADNPANVGQTVNIQINIERDKDSNALDVTASKPVLGVTKEGD